jgi:hypothetical protein
MAFDWRDFFLFAHQLRHEQQENIQRTAIGRAYYYAFNVALVEARKLGFNPASPSLRRMSVHQRLWSWCQSQANKDLVALGDSGNTLKARRTSMDYILFNAPSHQDVQKQLDETRHFEVLLARITNRPAPLSP